MPVQQRVTMPGMQVLIHHRAVVLAPGLIVFESHTTTVHTAPDKLFCLVQHLGQRLSGGVA